MSNIDYISVMRVQVSRLGFGQVFISLEILTVMAETKIDAKTRIFFDQISALIDLKIIKCCNFDYSVIILEMQSYCPGTAMAVAESDSKPLCLIFIIFEIHFYINLLSSKLLQVRNFQ